MNILHLIENLDTGGAQIRLINDLRFMDKARFNNTVCSLAADGKLSKEISGMGIKLYALDGVKNAGNFLKLARIIRENRIDILHTQIFFADLYGRLIGKLLKVPAIVSTVQASAYEPDNEYLYSLKRKLLDRFTGMLCNKKFIAVSEFVKSSMSKHLKISPEKIEVIVNYVDIDMLNTVDEEKLGILRKELRLSPCDIVAVTIGRLNPAKGVQYLLKALSGIAAQYKSIRLFIIGDGFYRNYLERLVLDYGLTDNVRFLGERDDVKELLHISDIFIFPTLSEGLPVSLLEAIAIGKPALASDIGPVREVIKDGETGILFKPSDSQDIQRALIEIIQNPDLGRQLAQRAKGFIKIKFDPQRQIRLLEEVYVKLLQ